jgi:outer membrane protein OmpU|tara:strand:- start:3754 stop:4710 length:957 start_codon:yes stop_codon:yes gene_type:complete
MNKFKKIGLSALAGSLVAFSANAGSLSASGSASLTFSNAWDESLTHEGNQWTMGDSVTFTGSGEMDNGMTISVSYELDGDGADTGSTIDSHSMTLDTNGMGTITFAGHGGSSAMSAIDDVTPNAYEESWDVVTGAATPPGGVAGNNMFTYKSPDLGGATITVAYINASDAITDVSYMDFAIVATPSMVDGLTVGFGMAETEETTGTVIDDTTMYAKYTYGSMTIGYQIGESDGPTSASDIDFEGLGVTYAVTDDFTIGYSTSEIDKASDTDVQEATAIGASYTSGGITVGGSMNSVDNVGYDASADRDGYEFNIAFAF